MIVWITSSGRSGNTFFRIVMHQLYGVRTYAAFNASEVLKNAGAGELVGAEELPSPLDSAVRTGHSEQIRLALEELDARKELYVFKTHAQANHLFGTNFRAILLVRDGRDAISSYANYLVDVRFDRHMLKTRLRRMAASRSQLLDPASWDHVAKILAVATAKRLGLRKRLVRWRINQLLNERHRLHTRWGEMNESWLEREPKPVVVRFNDLIRDPVGTVTQAVDELGIGLTPRSDASIPTFAELQKRYASFFRKGTSGDWKNYFSPAHHELFARQFGEVMRRLDMPISASNSESASRGMLQEAKYLLLVGALPAALEMCCDIAGTLGDLAGPLC